MKLNIFFLTCSSDENPVATSVSPAGAHGPVTTLDLSLCEILLYCYLRVELDFVPAPAAASCQKPCRADVALRVERLACAWPRRSLRVCKMHVGAYSWPCKKVELQSPDPIGPVGFDW
jgi:hypothetical protein